MEQVREADVHVPPPPPPPSRMQEMHACTHMRPVRLRLLPPRALRCALCVQNPKNPKNPKTLTPATPGPVLCPVRPTSLCVRTRRVCVGWVGWVGGWGWGCRDPKAVTPRP